MLSKCLVGYCSLDFFLKLQNYDELCIGSSSFGQLSFVFFSMIESTFQALYSRTMTFPADQLNCFGMCKLSLLE